MNQQQELKLESIAGALSVMGIAVSNMELKFMIQGDIEGAARAATLTEAVEKLQAHVAARLAEVEAV